MEGETIATEAPKEGDQTQGQTRMTAKSKSRSSPRAGTRYLQLIRRFPLCPIRSDEQLHQAIEVVNNLLDRGPRAPGANACLDALGRLVMKDGTEHHPMPRIGSREHLFAWVVDTRCNPWDDPRR